jgi:hypothetical protein
LSISSSDHFDRSISRGLRRAFAVVGAVKFTVTIIRTGTGCPLTIVGSNLQCRTARSAAFVERGNRADNLRIFDLAGFAGDDVDQHDALNPLCGGGRILRHVGPPRRDKCSTHTVDAVLSTLRDVVQGSGSPPHVNT